MGQKMLEYDPNPFYYSAKCKTVQFESFSRNWHLRFLCTMLSFHTKDNGIKQPSHHYSVLLNSASRLFGPLYKTALIFPISAQALMAKNQTSATSEGACEKICKAILCISCCPESSEPRSAAPSSLPLLPDQEKTTSEVISADVPIKFNTPVEQTSKPHTSIQKNGQVTRVAPNNELLPTRVAESEKAKRVVDIAQPEQLKTKVEKASSAGMAQSKGEEGKNPGPDNGDEKFSNYIDRAKAMIRTTTTVGGGGRSAGRSASRLDSFNDRVTNYINRAKVKIRTNSSAGFGKSVSIK